MPTVQIGDKAPEFTFRDESGREQTLSLLRGGPVVLAFASTPQPDGAVLQHVTVEGEQIPVLSLSHGATAALYGLERQRAVFVVGANGRIAWQHIGNGTGLIPPDSNTATLTRREFIAAMLAASLVASLSTAAHATAAEAPATDSIVIAVTVNGKPESLTLDPRVSLLDALREHLHHTGTKKGCDHGQCGACTVHVEGRRVLSCLTLAVSVDGQSITTIEGIAREGQLHPIQQAFIHHDGFQCGYCTPGQIMSAVALLAEPCGPDDDDVRDWMSGNICRCGAYAGIVSAIQSVRGQRS